MRHLWLQFAFISTFLILSNNHLIGQFDPIRSCIVDQDGFCLSNTILTSVLFLKINASARSGGIGETGMAISPDPNSINYNLTSITFAKENTGVSINYTPWQNDIGFTNTSLSNFVAYHKLNGTSAIALSYTHFNIGEINFTNTGRPAGTIHPTEYFIGLGYSKILGSHFSGGLLLKYIQSNLATITQIQGLDIQTGKSVAADISFSYTNKSKSEENKFAIGLSISNLGSKISYTTRQGLRDYIPTNLGIGGAYTFNVNEKTYFF